MANATINVYPDVGSANVDSVTTPGLTLSSGVLSNDLTTGASLSATATSASNPTWKALNAAASTFTLTGTTTVTAMHFGYIGTPTITGAGAAVVTDAYSFTLESAPTMGGAVTATRKGALWVKAGVARIDGTLYVGNIAPPTTLGAQSSVAVFNSRDNSTLGTAHSIMVAGANNTGYYATIGFGYTGIPTNDYAYAAGAFGLVATSGAGSVKGDFIWALRNATTDTAPSIKMRMNCADGSLALLGQSGSTPFTLAYPATDYGEIGYISATTGGLSVIGLSTGASAKPLYLGGYNGANSVTAGLAMIQLDGAKWNSATWVASLAATDTLYKLTNNGTAVQTTMGDGTVIIGTMTTLGGGAVEIALSNATTDPTTNPTGGGLLYASGGALKWRGSSGTVTTIAIA